MTPPEMPTRLFDRRSGRLLGARMIGSEVTELMGGFAIGKTGELVAEDLFETIFPHPTISETMHESSLAAFDRVLHV